MCHREKDKCPNLTEFGLLNSEKQLADKDRHHFFDARLVVFEHVHQPFARG